MTRTTAPLLALLAALSACTSTMESRAPVTTAPVPIRIISFNDFHGYLTPPKLAITLKTPSGDVKVPAGGAAYFASAVAKLKAGNPLNVTVSAGDMTGASPLASSLFLDEPTVMTMSMIGGDFNAVGNHEFDRGQDELLRLQNGGCAKFTTREPCQIEKGFPGASYKYLSANTVKADGGTLFPPYAIKSFTQGATTIRIGFIGMTLKGTGAIVSAAGIQGIHFASEAETANALLPKLKAAGADIVIVLIHEGGTVTAPHGDQSCAGLDGDILPILDALDPSIELVISGHTHKDYICDYGKVKPGRNLLLTSAGQYGTLLTDIELLVDPVTKKILSKKADNLIVQGEGYEGANGPVPLTDQTPTYPAEPRVAALVDRYKAASATVTARIVGHVTGPISREENDAGELALGNLIADAQLAAMKTIGAAQMAFMNRGGVRAELLPGPDGAVTYGTLYTIQPFGNALVTKSYTGKQILDLLEEQFTRSAGDLRILSPSANLRYSFDRTKPDGSRVSDVTLDGKPLNPTATYRVAISNFLGDGGDGYTVLKTGTNPVNGPLDLEALEAYFKAHPGPIAPPALDRIHRADKPAP
ncbi:bifunctional metallophosphatase/5'-nucleotidase [soil metagenome]